MEIVINISQYDYDSIIADIRSDTVIEYAFKAIKEGKILPEGHGEPEECICYLENISKMFEQGKENCAGDAKELQQKHIDALQYAIQRIKENNYENR